MDCIDFIASMTDLSFCSRFFDAGIPAAAWHFSACASIPLRNCFTSREEIMLSRYGVRALSSSR